MLDLASDLVVHIVLSSIKDNMLWKGAAIHAQQCVKLSTVSAHLQHG